MKNNLPAIVSSYQSLREQGHDLVLAAIIETEGSTYRKAGACMLITHDRDFYGLLGGGCFENDLLEHAQQVFDNHVPKIVTYDMRGPEDVIWGLGLGCNGAVRIFLQYLADENDYSPLSLISGALTNKQKSVLLTVCESEHPDIQAGNHFMYTADNQSGIEIEEHFSMEVRQQTEKTFNLKSPLFCKHSVDRKEVSIFYTPVNPAFSLLLLGAGPDAVPVVHFAKELGWEVTVADHRESYANIDRFPDADNVIILDSDSFTSEPVFRHASAIVLMTHNFERDQHYLSQLSDSNARYIGLLGPSARRDKLLESPDVDKDKLLGRIYGPVGLDIGSELPEEIALSLIAEIQAVLNNRPAGYLSGNDRVQENNLLNVPTETGSTEENLHIVILAAGGSVRFGGIKQLLEFNGISLLRRSIMTAKGIFPERVHVVLGPKALKMQREINDIEINTIINADWETGIASSLKTGLVALPEDCHAVLFMLCDQPLIMEHHLRTLITKWSENQDSIVASAYGETVGVPAIIPRKYFPEILKLTGDEGAKNIITAQLGNDNIETIDIPEAEIDIDTQEDFMELLNRSAS